LGYGLGEFTLLRAANRRIRTPVTKRDTEKALPKSNPARFARNNDPVSTTILMSRPHIAILINGEELVSGTAKEIAKSLPS
jgi:hypothetical protein